MKLFLSFFIFLLSFNTLADGQPPGSPDMIQKRQTALLKMQDTVLIGAIGNKGVITVFADPHCPHCRDFYAHAEEIIEQGYAIQFALLPITDHSAEDYSNIVCSSDPIKFLDQAYKNNTIAPPVPNCHKDFASQLQVSQLYVMMGTPFIILPDGRYRQGFSTMENFNDWIKGGK